MLRALMSAPPAGGDGEGRLVVALARAADRSLERPRLDPDVELARFRTRWGERYLIAHSPSSHAYLRFDGDEGDVVGACDGSHTVGELVVDALARGGGLDADRVAEVVFVLRARGFLDRPALDIYAVISRRLLPRRRRLAAVAAPFVRKQTIPIPGADALTDRLYRAGGRMAFTPAATVVGSMLLAAGLAAFIAVGRHGGHTLVGHVSAATALSLVGMGMVTLFIHETSHALAVRHAGRRVVSAGFQLYLGHPAFFIDSTDLTLSPPRARAINAMAGPYAEAVAAGVAAIGAWLANRGPGAELLFRFAGITYLNVLVNLIPFLELDGYWLVSDLLDIPRLRPRSFAVLRFELPDRLRGRRGRFSRAERGLALFGVVGVLFTAAALFTAWTFWGPIVRRLAVTLWHGGAPGRVVLLVLVAMILGPAVNALGHASVAVGRRGRAAVGDLRFWLQTRWRAEAAGAVVALEGVGEIAPENLADLAGRVRRRRVRPGQVVVREGSAGDAFFVVRAGRLAVSAEGPDGAESLRHLAPGDAFGELALLEGRPRTATVRAETDGELFEIDAGTFGRVIAPALDAPGLGEYQRSLLEVWSLPPFRQLPRGDAASLARRGEWRGYGPDETLMAQGEPGDRFYVIGAGQVEVLIDGERRALLRAGDHFGELALLHAVPRTATVRTVTRARLFSLDAAAFDELVAGAFRRACSQPSTTEHDTSGAH